MNSERVLLIGLDGATLDLIKPWAEDGKLPNMARLLEEGAHGVLRSVPNMNSAPAWTSFATGKNPGKHGIFYFSEPIPGTYERRYVNGSCRVGKSFWGILSKTGRKVLVINVPMTYPAEEVNGIVLAGLDSPRVESPGFAHPPSILGELRSNVGDYIIEPGIPGFIKAGRRDQALKRLYQAIDKRTAYARYLMSKHPWDLAIIVFTAIDAAQHFFWKDMDSSHPEHDTQEAHVFGDAILAVYQRIDQAVGTLVQEAGGATVIIMSDHGGGFNQRGAEYLNPWLEMMGYLSYLKPYGNVRKRTRGALFKQTAFLYRQLDRHLSRELKSRLATLLPGLRTKVESAIRVKDIDWSRTLAFADGARDEMWINLAGREPKGAVQPEDYESVRSTIIEALTESRDPITGESVAQQVCRREDIYWGPHVGKAPDINVRWTTDFVVSGLVTDGICVSRGALSPLVAPNNGGHRLHGTLIVKGQSVERGIEVDGAQIIDLAPTILYLFGEPIPSDMDGRALEEIFEPRFVADNPLILRDVEPEERRDFGRGTYTEEEEREIEERLKGMGYLG
jgi:predicted AlkP superfamily phosphohydrolase/phosphomutase